VSDEKCKKIIYNIPLEGIMYLFLGIVRKCRFGMDEKLINIYNRIEDSVSRLPFDKKCKILKLIVEKSQWISQSSNLIFLTICQAQRRSKCPSNTWPASIPSNVFLIYPS
jgi:hypothetical protein